MMKFLRRNQKKVLAIFTAGLMIAFIADTGYNRYQSAGAEDGNYAVGTIGGAGAETELKAGDVKLAENELRILLQHAVLQTRSPNPAEQFASVLQLMVPEHVIRQWMANPVAFALLKEEARRMPVSVDPGELELNLNEVNVRLRDGRTVPLDKAGDLQNPVRRSVAELLLVMEAFSRSTDIIKVSQPMVMHDVVLGSQKVTVRFVEFPASEFLADAPQPSDEQLHEHFKKYADLGPAAAATETNPLGFGYRYPPRVKLQYVAVPREQVRNVIKAKKDDYRWELDANKYYLQNQKEFAHTGLSTTQAATQPTTRPFEEVREQVLDKVMAPQVIQLTEEINKKIEATLRADYEAWARVHTSPTTAPATAPAEADAGSESAKTRTTDASSAASVTPATQPVVSSLSVPYDSYEYLERLAQSIQQQYGVLPTVASIAEPKSEDQLREMPGIGEAASSLFFMVEPFVPEAMRGNEAVLRVWEPSEPRADAGGSTYVYRVTEAKPAQAPADLAEVRDKVAEDVKRLRAWEQGKAVAQRALEQARSTSLASAAGERKLVTAGPFSKFNPGEIPGAEFATPAAKNRFATESYKMLSEIPREGGVAARSRHPLRLIELPEETKVVVAELASVETPAQATDTAALLLRQPLAIRQEWMMRARPRWLSYEGVAARMKYVDNDPSARRTSAAVP